jgi:antitoxin component of RelBE/YafQ-DinJ toxin-antitoxin module
MNTEYTTLKIKIEKDLLTKATKILTEKGITLEQFVEYLLSKLIESNGTNLNDLLKNVK